MSDAPRIDLYEALRTTRAVRRHRRDAILLEIPPPWATGAFVAIGWPERRGHGALSRRPVERMAFGDRFGGGLF